MSTENPKFNSKSNSSNVNEELKSEKEIQWEQKRKEIDKIIDGAGQGIDEGIKETVVAFNLNGISTYASCEGHPEVRGGHRPWPWIDVAEPEEPEERFVGENQAFENAARKNNISLEDLKRGYPGELYWEVQKQICENPETLEYKKWEAKNKKLCDRVIELLDEFYNGRKVDPDIQIKVEEFRGGPAEISSESTFLVKFLDNKLTDEEKIQLLNLLPKRQKEMQDFTAFLKKRFYKI